MKHFFTFILLLLFVGCMVSKQKNKEKSDLSEKTEQKINENKTVKKTSTQNKDVTDSTKASANVNIDRSITATLQNFSLKNNGKCAEPGTTRTVLFTDILGNKTEIPVNDNTDLDFGSESEDKKEVESLIIEISNLKKYNERTDKINETVYEQNKYLRSQLDYKTSQLETETEKNSFWTYVWIVLLSVLIWELIKFLIKKYFLKK